MKNFKLTPILAAFLLVTSCDKPACENTNVIFDKFSPDQEEYKTELIRQLKMEDAIDYSYWFDVYEVRSDHEYIKVDVVGKKLCAKALIQVTDWTKLDGIKKSKGGGYHGAELAGLQFEIVNNPQGSEFVFKDVDYVID